MRAKEQVLLYCLYTKAVTVAAGMLFGWETVMTFVLVSTVYAVAIGEPSFGVVGPFAVGLSLFAMVFAGELSLMPHASHTETSALHRSQLFCLELLPTIA